MDDNYFTKGLVAVLCGGKLPHANGFLWDRVEYFKLENGIFQPYSDGQILPGPGLKITLTEVE